MFDLWLQSAAATNTCVFDCCSRKGLPSKLCFSEGSAVRAMPEPLSKLDVAVRALLILPDRCVSQTLNNTPAYDRQIVLRTLSTSLSIPSTHSPPGPTEQSTQHPKTSRSRSRSPIGDRPQRRQQAERMHRWGAGIRRIVHDRIGAHFPLGILSFLRPRTEPVVDELVRVLLLAQEAELVASFEKTSVDDRLSLLRTLTTSLGIATPSVPALPNRNSRQADGMPR